jgi:hypothetical protein
VVTLQALRADLQLVHEVLRFGLLGEQSAAPVLGVGAHLGADDDFVALLVLHDLADHPFVPAGLVQEHLRFSSID